MKAVIYARFSSSSQREESIEGQLQVCHEYAKANGYTVIEEYIDRAASATTDQRAQFQKMIADSDKRQFESVLVYQLDRFARNRYDSAINKGKLKKNGVRVISAKENIADDPSGVMLEGILETLAEYYSADLSQKIRRGHAVNAQKCIYNGGYSIPLGYKVDDERHFQIDEDTAPIAQRIFRDYANGKSIKDITDELNAAGLKTYKGTSYGKSSLQRMLKNRRYLGIYIYGDTEIDGGMPRLIDDETFKIVQERIETKKHTRASKGDFLLTTKLFCGHCGSMMVGDSGTSKSNNTKHYYYSCKKARKKQCDKKSIKRQIIEDFIVDECRKILTEENIAKISTAIADLSKSDANGIYMKQLKKELAQTDSALENLAKALEKGEEADFILNRIKQKRHEKEDIEALIATEKLTNVILSESEIRFFLTDLRNGDINDEKYRKMLVNVLVNEIYLYDDKTTIHFNSGDRPVEITLDLQEEALKNGVRMNETLLHQLQSNTQRFVATPCLSLISPLVVYWLFVAFFYLQHF